MEEVRFSSHAWDMLQERHIPEAWARQAMQAPDRTAVGHDHNMHYIKAIAEHGGRFLRVVGESARDSKAYRHRILWSTFAEGIMRLKVDRENDVLYFRLDESAIVESEEVQPGVILDFNAEGNVVGIEMLNLSTRVAPERLRVLQFETV